MKKISTLFFIVQSVWVFAQQEVDTTSIKLDSLYREDQFYVNLTYNILLKSPKDFDQNKLSPGICVGFLRDFPLNKKRDRAIAVGLGYSFNRYNFNLNSKKDVANNSSSYKISTERYDKSLFSQHFIELPVEFRWRTSTPNTHKFWRIYFGTKVSYMVYNNYTYIDQTTSYKYRNNLDLNKLHYGVYVAAGWNSVNFYAYYGINSLYKNAFIDSEKLKLNTLNVGFQFYIL